MEDNSITEELAIQKSGSKEHELINLVNNQSS